ncbi:MAG: class I SAM-dependent methyltransferase [Planctomycetota bacterium]
MSLVTIFLDVPQLELPSQSEALIADAGDRIADFVAAARGEGPAAFVPADFPRVYAALSAIYGTGLAAGDRCCEWGSGFGVVAALATHIGFEACGIEIERDLVGQAESLAADHDLSIEFAHGSFIPESAEHLADVRDDLATLGRGVADGYDELGLDPEDFALIYAYPWPGEEEVVERIFDAVAARGALLLTYRSTEDLVLQRKE